MKTELIHYFKQFLSPDSIIDFWDLLAVFFEKFQSEERDTKARAFIREDRTTLYLQINGRTVLEYQIEAEKQFLTLLLLAEDTGALAPSFSFEVVAGKAWGMARFVAFKELLKHQQLIGFWLKAIEQLDESPRGKKGASSKTNPWLYRVARESELRKTILENIRASSKYKPLVTKVIERVLRQPYFVKIQNLTTFWFANAQEVWKEWEALEIDKIALEFCLDNYNKYQGRFDAFVLEQEGQAFAKILELLGRLVAHIEGNATGKKQWNSCKDKRTIAATGVRQNLWVQQLLAYKIGGNDATKLLTPAIRNAILYLQYPSEKTPILSLRHQQKIAYHLLDISYQKERFAWQLMDYFNYFDIKIKNTQNYTFLIRQLLYHDDSVNLWKYEEEDVYQNELLGLVLNEPLNIYESDTKSTRPLNQIFYGPPGTGKTFESIRQAIALVEHKDERFAKQMDSQTVQQCLQMYSDLGRIVFTTFHQSMSYEDFVEGIKPEVVQNQIHYKVKDGLLKLLANRAIQNPKKPYVLLIDELNRGNVANIFGELITLLEEDKRLGAASAIQVVLPYSKERFGLPSNLYILATMNTSDRSIEHLDMALRRRFSFVEMLPDSNLLSEDIEGINLSLIHGLINQRIRVLLDNSHLLGHSYFMNIGNVEDLQEVFQTQIIPLLLEYFYGDCAKVGLILGADFVAAKRVDLDLLANFDYDGKQHYSDQMVFEIKDFPRPKKAYIAIYASEK